MLRAAMGAGIATAATAVPALRPARSTAVSVAAAAGAGQELPAAAALAGAVAVSVVPRWRRGKVSVQLP